MMISFTTWLVTALIVFGISLILSESTIFEPLRNYLAKRFYTNAVARWAWLLITCPMCTSFWVGMILSFFMPFPLTGNFFFDGILASVTSVFLLGLLDRLKEKPQTTKSCGCGSKSTVEEDL